MRQIRFEQYLATWRRGDANPKAPIPPLSDANEMCSGCDSKLYHPQGRELPNSGAVYIDDERADSWIPIPSATRLNEQPSWLLGAHRRTVSHSVPQATRE